MSRTKQSEFMTVEEAAAELGIAAKTVYNRGAGTGQLLRVRSGRSVRLLREQVMEHKRRMIEEATRLHWSLTGGD
jgi:excisionase family DNA binding protein